MNEYSSDTKKVVAKLAGMTDACANVHDYNECLTELFALAPVDATYVSDDGEYFCIDADGDWISVVKNGGGVCVSPYAPVLIPPRERELNNLADKNDEWHEGEDSYICDDGSFIDEQEWQARRQQRIAAGLIDVNDTDVVDMQDSQQEWVNGLPPVGVKCEFQCKHPSIASFTEWEVGEINYMSDRYIIVQDEVGDRCYDKTWSLNFRPIQPEQKPDDRDKARDEIRGMLSYPTSDDEKVVDLILEWHMSRLTQGGGDE